MVAAFPTREIRTVAVLYNPRRPDAVPPGEPPDRIAEYDAPGTAAAVADALAAAGYRPVVLEVDERLPCRLAAERPDAAFNLAEGLRGTSREAQVPALLEMLGIPYTGSGVDSLVLCQDKQLAKEVLAAHGVDSPRGVAVPPGDVARALDVAARCGYPLMVKPVAEGSSMGVDGDACARDQDELLTAVARIHLLYRQPALVEEFLPGREFTVGIVGNRPPRALPVREVAFDAVPHPHGGVYSYRFKQAWDDPSYFLC
ncbi:MAG: D-alanine--D-alanine ligase, partial [Clostridia bacterium]|nr:D-alanine--D-alanine ligase [Clostridia bacterium]